jgi:hypothetical protein
MARKYLDTTGLTALWAKIKGFFVKRSGDVMTGALVALAFTASANGSPTIVSQSTDVDVSKADNNISSDRYPAWVASDKYGRILTRMECVASSNGNIAAYWYVRNYNTSGSQVAQKGIKIAMAKDGSITYTIDDNSKFRTALGLATVASSGSYNDLSNKPFTWDINTENTTDTWVPVMTGSTMQHRVLSTSYNGKSVVGATSSVHNLPSYSNSVIPSTQYLAYWNGAYNSSGNSNLQRCDRGRFGTVVTKNSDGMWNHSDSAYQNPNSILSVSNDGTTIDVSNLRTRFWPWTSDIYIDCRTNRSAAGIVYVFNGNNTEIIRIYCAGSPTSSWNAQRLGDSSMSNCTWSAANVTIGSDTYTRLHIYGGGQRTFWAIYGVSDKWQH